MSVSRRSSVRPCSLIAIACAALAACTDAGDPWLRSTALDVPSGPLSYDGHIKPILQKYGCLGCHPAGGGSGGLDVSSPESLQEGGDSGRPAVVECEPEHSYMAYRVRWCEMPQSSPPYSNCVDELEVAIIERWIAQGGRATYEPGACPDAPGIDALGNSDE